MNVQEAITSRRAIKHYDPEHELSPEQLRLLVSAAALAPTSFNIQNRHVVAITDKVTQRQLQAGAWGQAHVADASVVLVFTADLGAHRRTERYLRNAPDATRQHLEPMIANFYDGKPDLLRDEACRSVGMAAMNVMLTARDLGLECCPMIGFDPVEFSRILGLDEEHPPLMMVVVGKGTKPAHSRMGLLELEESCSLNRFGQHDIAGTPELAGAAKT